jgi:tyrosyl-tRNA synthetase
MLIGRELQKKMNNREKFVLTTPMIIGTNGQPMSKTSGNCVWLNDSPEEMFGKLMSLPDDQIVPYLELTTNVPLAEVEDLEQQLTDGANPRDSKARMAYEVTKIWHDEEAASRASQNWQQQFSEGNLPADIEEHNVQTGVRQLDELLVETGLASSRSEARRLVEQGGVRLNQAVIKEAQVNVNLGDVLQAGKRRFVRLQ